jgi:multicomponent Na+:H+ antiporter subunit G
MSGVEVVIMILTLTSITFGVVFILAGTLGMLRFPDVYTRLHALTKADTLGLGFVSLGLILVAPGWAERIKIIVIWGFLLLAATTAAHLVARSAVQHGVNPREES